MIAEHSAAQLAVAVVIPAHDSAETLGATLASVAAQSSAPAEVIVVDDGSTDASAGVAERWSALLPLRVVRAEHAGAALARHRGVGATTSPLVALLDADDVWLPDHLETMVRTWAGRPEHLVSAFALWWVPGARVWTGSPEPLPAAGDQLRLLLRANFASGSALFARSLYERAGGFRGGFEVGEDWDLWIRMVRSGARVVRTDHPTFCYRLSRRSLTAGGRRYEGAERVLEAAVAEAASDQERRWAEEGLRLQGGVRRRARASMALVDAYEAARAGRRREARRMALRALWGPAPVASRALGVLVAPRTTVALRDRAVANRR